MDFLYNFLGFTRERFQGLIYRAFAV